MDTNKIFCGYLFGLELLNGWCNYYLRNPRVTVTVPEPAMGTKTAALLTGRDQKLLRTGLWPILWRELRSEARNGANMIVRLLGAAGITVLLALLLREDTKLSEALTLRLFTNAHALLALAIWGIAPVLTSDAIARERRAGTLCLLFATPLRAYSIVLAKSCVHMCRVVTLWLAAVPVLLVPMVFGGVTGLDVLSAVTIEFSIALLALGAGLAASARVKHPLGALLLAEAFAAGAVLAVAALLGAACRFQLQPLLPKAFAETGAGLVQTSAALLTGGMNADEWSGLFSAAGRRAWVMWLGELLVVSGCACAFFIALAILGTRAAWRDSPSSPRQERLRWIWLTPHLWLSRFSSERRQLLDGNPLHWVQQHSTSARLCTLGWCAIVLLLHSLLLLQQQPWRFYEETEVWLAIFLSLQMTYTAVMILRQERDSGALELLLVTPMSAGKIVFNLVCGFWRRFFPPLLLLLILGQIFVSLDLANSCGFDVVTFVGLNFGATPLIGLNASVRFQSFTAAFLFTAFFSLALPIFAATQGPGLPTGSLGVPLWLGDLWPTLSGAAAFLSWSANAARVVMAVVSSYSLWYVLTQREIDGLHSQ